MGLPIFLINYFYFYTLPIFNITNILSLLGYSKKSEKNNYIKIFFIRLARNALFFSRKTNYYC